MIRLFEKSDVGAAAALCRDLWGNEIRDYPPHTKEFIYEFWVRYYWRRQSLSFAFCEGYELKAFLLGFLPEDSFCSEEWYESGLKRFSEGERQRIQLYRDYLAFNSQAVRNACAETPVKRNAVLGLFASRGGGNGSLLRERFETECAATGIEAVLLWTDITCSYTYYDKVAYAQKFSFASPSFLPNEELVTYIYEKELN